MANAAAAGGQQSPAPAPTADHAADGARLIGAPGRPLAEVDPAWASGTDVIVTSKSSAGGFQILLAKESEKYAFRGLATLQPGGDDHDDWIGHQCLTGNGRHVLAVVARRGMLNTRGVRDRGGLAYSVSTATGRVLPLLAGAAVKAHALGCGHGDRAVLLRHLGDDQEQSELVQVDLDRGGVLHREVHEGQLTHAVPIGRDAARTVLALRGKAVVDATSARRERTLAVLASRPVSFRPSSRDAVDALVGAASAAEVVTVSALGIAARRHVPGAVALALGSGRSHIVGRTADGARLDGEHRPLAVSLQGKASLISPRRPKSATPGAPHSGDTRWLLWADGSRLQTEFPDVAAPATTAVAHDAIRPSASGGRLPGSAALVITANSTTPTCAVPRNDTRKQALQPTNEQLDWAVQQAIRKALVGANGRPANYLNMGLAAYSPSTDFPPPNISGWPDAVVPPSVLNGILAQENAYRHASRRALPGIGGNPAVGDYYGSAGGLDVINYDEADCGYGAAQVTDGMRAGDGRLYSVNGKTKIAVDYAENVQVGLKILIQKWNQLRDVIPGGITLNNGDPAYIENWYFALWAYNSGVAPSTPELGNTTGCTPSPTCTDAGGRWGLGWTNNPANPDYPADRDLFLRATYADAETPGEWPYQERVLGWAETPILDYKGRPSYAKPTPNAGGSRLLTVPGPDAFCAPAANECSFGWKSPAGDGKDNCMRADRRCWWHEPVAYTDCPTSCHKSEFTYATSAVEPAAVNPYPPNCNSTLPANAVIVDNISPSYSIVGCQTKNWTSQGAFQYSVGTDAAGAPIGEIDFHQLANGFGGHVWFTGNRLASDTAHKVTGTWTPPAMAPGAYLVTVHIPRNGATATSALYTVTTTTGPVTRAVDQHLHENRWITLGAFTLGDGAKVELTNVTRDDTSGGGSTVAFDAVAFVPVQGTYRTRDIDSVAVFDRSTNIDTNFPTSWLAGPSKSRASLHTWAKSQTSEALSMPACLPGTVSKLCLHRNTQLAFAAWDRQLVSGTSTNPPPGLVTIPEWLGFASPRPPPGRRDEAIYTDDQRYKIRSRTRISWVEQNGSIIPGTQTVEYEHRTGNTHMPRFAVELLAAIAADYPSIGRPTLAYNAVDLNRHDHRITSVDATTSGVLPGRAYRTAAQNATLTPDNKCLRTLMTQGGSIGYRPMLAEPGAANAVEAWKERAKQAEINGTAPPIVARFAEQLKDMFFDRTGLPGESSAFRLAPPIWQEVNAQVCVDGTLSAAPTGVGPIKLLRQSHMPDGYLYLDGVLVDGTGRPSSVLAPLTSPLQRGNFQLFSNLETEAHNPSRACIVGWTNEAESSDGNPWGMTQITGSPGDNPENVIHCHNPVLAPDPEHAS